MKKAALVALVIAGMLGAVPPPSLTAQRPSPDAQALEYYRSGQEFAHGQHYEEALKDFATVVETYPDSEWAEPALYEIARIRFEAYGHVALARNTLDTARQRYAGGAVKPWWDILDARMRLATSRTGADVDDVINMLSRIPRVFQGSDAVPAALFFSGEAFRQAGVLDKAAEGFQQVAREYSQSPWAARALLGQARINLSAGRTLEAIRLVQRVIDRFPDTEAAAIAAAWNTILVRLYARPSGAPYRPAGSLPPPAAEVRGLAVTPDGRLFVAAGAGVFVTPAAHAAYAVVGKAESVSVDARGQVFLVWAGGFSELGGAPVTIALPQPPDRRSRPPERLEGIAALAVTSARDFIVADQRRRTVYRYGGSEVEVWLDGVRVRQMAISDDDEIAVLSADRAVEIHTRFGRVRKLSVNASGKERFNDPRDIALDSMGHVYVLDRGHRSVMVFAPDGRFVRAFESPAEREPHAFRRAAALAVDRAGTLFIFDERSRQIQIYQ
jgi:outer membrane protein assembly factor BamD (BamD/ComL family)